ncbi:MAG: hotdog fold thioesterase [Pyrinomonadaceae bacterium]|nr:hotdog fold thioesterase [Pyrinomonadaceae bacterium]
MDLAELLEQTRQSELLKLLDISIETAEKGFVRLQMPVTSKVHQYIGIMNGGISLLLAETAASLGAVVSSDLSKVTPVGIEINANHLRAVSRGIVTAEAKNIYHGRTLSVWNVEITNERGKMICVSRCTLSLKKGAAFPPQKDE